MKISGIYLVEPAKIGLKSQFLKKGRFKTE
jgi:hypothetical protein